MSLVVPSHQSVSSSISKDSALPPHCNALPGNLAMFESERLHAMSPHGELQPSGEGLFMLGREAVISTWFFPDLYNGMAVCQIAFWSTKGLCLNSK